MTNKNKIAVVLHSVGLVGGLERITVNLANALSSYYQVDLISLHGPDKPFFKIEKNINLIYIETTDMRLREKFFLKAKKLKEIFKKNKYDVVLVSDTYLIFILLFSLTYIKSKLIMWEHCNFYANWGHPLVWKIARKLCLIFAKKTVVLTERDKNYFIKELGHKEKLVVIPNPIPNEVAVKSIFTPFSKREKTVLAVGRLNEQKGFDILLSVWKKLEEKNQKWKLQIVGSGPTESKLKNIAKELQLKHVEFIPVNSCIDEYYKKASIYVMSSRYEGFGLVLIEAKSFGLPCVAFNCDCGPEDIIRNDLDGYLVTPYDEDLMANKIENLIEDKKKREIFSKNSFEDSKKFRMEFIITYWENLFNTIIK